MKVGLRTSYQKISVRHFNDENSSIWAEFAVLRYDHDLRKRAVDRFFRGHLKWDSIRVTVIYELDDPEGLKKLARLLSVELNIRTIRESLSDYIEGKKTLSQTYDDFLPLIVADKLKE